MLQSLINPTSGFSNRDLLSALNYGKDINLRHFYTDLDFGIGKIRTGTFLDIEFSPISKSIEQDEANWRSFKLILIKIESFYEKNFTNPSLEQAESDFQQRNDEWRNDENQNVIRDINTIIEKIRELMDGLNFSLLQISPEISSRKQIHSLNMASDQGIRDTTSSVVSSAASSLQNVMELSNQIIDGISGNNREHIDEIKVDKLTDFINTIHNEMSALERFVNDVNSRSLKSIKKSINTNLKELKSNGRNLRRLIDIRVLKPKYRAEINGILLVDTLKNEQQNIRSMIKDLQTDDLSSTVVTKFISDCVEKLKIIDLIFTDYRLQQAIGVTIPNDRNDGDKNSSRIHVQIDKIFDAGKNVILYGEAGGGKTTTLEMYAMKKAESGNSDWLPLFLPLTKIIGRSDIENNFEDNALSLLEEKIIQHLNANKLSISKINFRDILVKRNKVIFLLDGLDEVIRTSPWIVKAITDLPQIYPNAQLIISSRISSDHLDHIEFLKLTLLPFDDEQLVKFISAWFDHDKNKAEPIRDHLRKNSGMLAIVKTPLLATIFCILAEYKVPLPTSEINLYKERLKLLLGHYDTHKGVRRQETHHELLEEVARKTAFAFQSRTKRMATIDEIKGFSIQALSNKYSKDAITTAVDELCNPCSILVPMSINQGEWGFGHLRFQEHLAAEELVKNRGIEIEPLLTTAWWRSVLILFAQMTDDFEVIFNKHILTHGIIGGAYKSLRAMISARPEVERNGLLRLLENHKNIDEHYDSEETELDWICDTVDFEEAWQAIIDAI